MVENVQVYDFELSDGEMEELDALMTKDLYQKSFNRDTIKDGSMDGVKMEITTDWMESTQSIPGVITYLSI